MKPAYFKERHDLASVTLRMDCPKEDIATWLMGLTKDRAHREGLLGIHSTTWKLFKDDDGNEQYIEVACEGYKK